MPAVLWFGFFIQNVNWTLRASSTIRGHDYKLFLNYLRVNVRKHFFGERVVPIWNKLKCNIRDFSSIRHFKTSIVIILWSKLIYTVTHSATHGDLLLPMTRTVTYGPRSFAVSGPTIWNTLPSTLRVATTLGQFQSGLKTILFHLAYGTWLGAFVTI